MKPAPDDLPELGSWCMLRCVVETIDDRLCDATYTKPMRFIGASWKPAPLMLCFDRPEEPCFAVEWEKIVRLEVITANARIAE